MFKPFENQDRIFPDHGEPMAERLFFEERNERAVMAGEESFCRADSSSECVGSWCVLRVKSDRGGIDTFMYAAFHILRMNQT